MTITLKTETERHGLGKDRLTWKCPGCNRPVYADLGEDQAEIKRDPLCCYCRARQKPEDERNNIVLNQWGTFSRVKRDQTCQP